MEETALKKSFKTIWLVASFFILGAILRAYQLSTKSIWCDEAFSILLARNPISKIFNYLFHSSNQKFFGTPVYCHDTTHALLLKLWSIFGSDIFAARLLSAVFGALSIFMIYQVARLLADKKTSLISALLVTISPFYIQFSQTARMYTLTLFFGTASIFFFLKILKGSGKFNWNWPGYIFTTTLNIYLHPFGVIMLLIQNLYILIQRRKITKSTKKWLISQGFVGIFIVPYLILWLRQMIIHSGGLYLETPSFKLPFISLAAFFYNLALGNLSPSGESLIIIIFTIVAYGACFTLGTAFFYKEKTEPLFLYFWLFIPIALIMPLGFKSLSFGGARQLIQFTPPFYILVAYGLTKIEIKSSKIFAVLLVVFITISILSLINWYKIDDNYGLREGAQLIKDRPQKNDFVLHTNGCSMLPIVYYLNSAQNQYLFDTNNIEIDNKLAENTTKEAWLFTYQLTSKRKSFVEDQVEENKLNKEQEKFFFNKGFNLSRRISFPSNNPVEIYLFERINCEQN